jgi:hypothetical protein
MSVVIIGHLLICYPTIVGLVAGLSTIFIIGFSRVFSRSRFPHQIVGSWLLGVLGLLISVDCCKRFNIDRLYSSFQIDMYVKHHFIYMYVSVLPKLET